MESAFDALASLARRTLRAPLTRRQLEEVLQEQLEQELPLRGAFPLHVRSDRNEPDPTALQIDAKAFSGGPASYPALEVWASGLIEPLDKTARWLRSHSVSRVVLGGSYRLTTALALGWSLRSAHGFELDVPTRGGTWRTDERPRTGETAPDWEIKEPESLCGEQLAVSVGVLRNPALDLPNTAGVPCGSVLGFHLATALASAPEAQASASLVKRTIDEFVALLKPERHSAVRGLSRGISRCSWPPVECDATDPASRVPPRGAEIRPDSDPDCVVPRRSGPAIGATIGPAFGYCEQRTQRLRTVSCFKTPLLFSGWISRIRR